MYLNINMTWKLYDIIVQYKEKFFFETYIRYHLYFKNILHSSSLQRNFSQTYTRYSLYFKDIWYNCSAQRKVCLKHIPDITFTLNIYDIFAMYTRWNIYTNQMKVKNYTSWNIETKPMTLCTYTSRCRKLHLKLSTLPTCSDGWNWGVAHCTKVWGPCYFSPLSKRDSLVPSELACKGDT